MRQMQIAVTEEEKGKERGVGSQRHGWIGTVGDGGC